MGPGSTLSNYGTIQSTGTAVLAQEGGVTLHNAGTVTGSFLSQGHGSDTVTNVGTIAGDVSLGRSADSYDGRGGFIQGVVSGGRGADVLLGGNEAEHFSGGRGADVIRGGSGDDYIDGGAGRDFLRGGEGTDAFVFAHSSKADRIVDFSTAEDRILLDNKVWKKIGSDGMLSASAFHVGARANDDDHRVIYNAKTGVLKYDANGDGPGGVIKIAKLMSGLDLDHHHFEII
jgi:Ca2+-binding RTX toxin-like protein